MDVAKVEQLARDVYETRKNHDSVMNEVKAQPFGLEAFTRLTVAETTMKHAGIKLAIFQQTVINEVKAQPFGLEANEMCNCKKEMEARLLEKCSQEPGEDHKIKLMGYGYILSDNKLEYRPVMPIEHTYMHTAKNGNKKSKTDKISMVLSHCPFCGEKVVE